MKSVTVVALVQGHTDMVIRFDDLVLPTIRQKFQQARVYSESGISNVSIIDGQFFPYVSKDAANVIIIIITDIRVERAPRFFYCF